MRRVSVGWKVGWKVYLPVVRNTGGRVGRADVFGGSMAARATRSASRAARVTEAVATGPLGALSHDELGVIFDGLADPLQPVVAVALSSTCLGLRTPLRAALKVLHQQHENVKRIGRMVWARGTFRNVWKCSWLANVEHLSLTNKGLTLNDMATLGTLLRRGQLPKLHQLDLDNNGGRSNTCADAGMEALFEGLGRGSAPALESLNLCLLNIGPAGAQALAAALHRGALPTLRTLYLTGNPIGNQGVAALATPLRKLPLLSTLVLCDTGIGDEGITSLVADLGKDDFKKLELLWNYGFSIKLDGPLANKITEVGWATLVAALDAGGMPALIYHHFLMQYCPHVCTSAVQAVRAALTRAQERRDAKP